MFSLKHNLMLLFGSLLGVSCTLPEPYQASNPQQNPPVAGVVNPSLPKTPEQIEKEAELKKARDKANAEAKARRERLKQEQEANGGGSSSDTTDLISPIKREPVKRTSKYRTARAIVTKPGYVFNPWTNKAVDVRGIPSGTLIRDPNDGNPDHKFRVP
ncbi:MAG: hypothetical protein ABF391_01420 [Akkermansiaceae bacterium]|jgi:hypothetical protein